MMRIFIRKGDSVVLQVNEVHDLCQRISDENDPDKIAEMMLSLRYVLASDTTQRRERLDYIVRYWPHVLMDLEQYLHEHPGDVV